MLLLFFLLDDAVILAAVATTAVYATPIKIDLVSITISLYVL